jgi:hypothetical protein
MDRPGDATQLDLGLGPPDPGFQGIGSTVGPTGQPSRTVAFERNQDACCSRARRGQRDALTAEDSRSRDRSLATPRDDDLGHHRSLRRDHAGSRSPLSCWRASCDGRSRSSALRKDSRAIRYQEAEERPAPRAVRPRILPRPSGSPGRSDCRLGSSPRRESRRLGAS